MPGIVDLLKADFDDVPVRVAIPDQMGLRHPSFTQALSLVNYRGQLNEIDLLVQSALAGNQQLVSQIAKKPAPTPKAQSQTEPQQAATATEKRNKQAPKKRGQGLKKSSLATSLTNSNHWRDFKWNFR